MAKKDRKRKRRRRRRPNRSAERPQASGSIDQADRRLRDKIQKFAYQNRFREDFEPALARYFGEGTLESGMLSLEEGEVAGFQEWFFFDYITREGEPIIDIFARERGPRLPETQRDLLAKWREWNRYRLLEVQKVMPGTGLIAEDLLSGETLEIHDRAASRSVDRWQIILARLIYTDRLHFTGAGIPLPPMRKAAVVDYSRQLLADFKARNPDATLDEFYQQHGLDIYQFMERVATQRPKVLTPEGHELEPATAYYSVRNREAVFERLDQAEEFEFAGPASDDPEAWHFNWLLRGRSHVPEQRIPESEGTIVMETSQWGLTGAPQYRSLGDVTLGPNRLELSCMSRARMEAGKKLLESILGNLIRHHHDEVMSFDEFMSQDFSEAPPPQPVPPEEAEALMKEFFEKRHWEWLDESIPALGGKTPREAAQDPEGRAELIELLKSIEYTEERRRKAGEPWFDVNKLRRELGLPES